MSYYRSAVARIAFGLLLTAATAILLCSAQAGQEPVFRAETTLIQVEVQVLGPGGKPVLDLSKEDFILKENGRPQQIATFEFAGGTASAAEPKDTGASAVHQSPRQPHRIYILTEATYDNYLSVYEGVRKFLGQPQEPDTVISLAGTPFTGDRDKLLSTLELMRRNPNGRGSPGESGWIPPFVPRSAVEYERLQGPPAYSARRQRIERSSGRPRSWGFSEIAFQERLMLLTYTDLIRQLGIYPGKKTVILFSAGLDLSQENLDELNRLASEALRNRVTFYTVYTRGLSLGLRNGLHALATHTGGKALVDWNDLSRIFDWVDADSRNYYLLGYYPQGLAGKGRYRKIQVSVKRPGARVRTEQGYFEPLPFARWTQRQRELELYRTVLSQRPPSQLAVNTACEVFRGTDAKPLLLVTIAVPVQDLEAKRMDSQESIRLSITVRATDQNGAEPDRYHSWTVTKVYQTKVFEQSRKRGAMVVADTENLNLPTGNYELIVAVRDDQTGKTGTAKIIVKAPDFHLPFASSSLLLTTHRRQASRFPRFAQDNPFLVVEETLLAPEAKPLIHPGTAVYFLYEVYNVSASLLSNPPPFQMGLWSDGQRVDGARVAGKMFPLPHEQKLRYVAALDTSNLEPGAYTVYSALPSESGETKEVLRKEFQILSQPK